ncbi:MAG: tRNA pseudouridine(55) synthase TruB [Deltaproteobacteria bacterium]|jgi:tRNA pseudouridine55 synthase|nr:tRNA pseudouridine(55) synthase TruB [Deltaproteobacteria bacterium]
MTDTFPQLPQAHGVLVLDKPRGPSSARCLTTLKRMGQKKIGHAGTLDPMACGVLLVLLGHATKISNYLLEAGEKRYSGCLRLGRVTDTWDAEGRVLEEKSWEHISARDVLAGIHAWQGCSVQAVPPFSAAKHQGRPLYKLARAGTIIFSKEKNVEISHAELLEMQLPYVRFRVVCSSGTYIRSLAHSLGMRLGCGAVLTELTREYSHPFGLDAACSLDALRAEPERLFERVLPVTRALPHWPLIELSTEETARTRNGAFLPHDAQRMAAVPFQPGTHALLQDPDKNPLALAEARFVDGVPVWSVLRGLWH